MTHEIFSPKPSFLKKHHYTKIVTADSDIDSVWSWLNSMKTFSNGQMPPYRVEFINPNGQGDPSFKEGVYTNHHGPLLSACGMIGEMRKNEYRDLRYMYGSYVISFRLVRPTRLQFWLEAKDSQTQIKMSLDSYVSPKFEPIWNVGLKLFGMSFQRWVKRIFSVS